MFLEREGLRGRARALIPADPKIYAHLPYVIELDDEVVRTRDNGLMISLDVNGRAKVSQRAAQNVATLGLARLPHRRAPASGRPRLSQSWRLPGCIGPQGPTGVHIGVGLRLVLAGFALAQAIALAVHLKDVHMMGQTIQ